MSERATVIEIKKPLPSYAMNSDCPHCGQSTESGFGMLGGFLGPYTRCPDCGQLTSKSMEKQRAELFLFSF